jgi:hypothetical protein
MQANNATRERGGWLKASVFMLLLIGLLAGTYHTPRSAASSLMPPQNPDIVRGDWGPEELAEDSGWVSRSPQGHDAAASIPITFAQPGEGPVAITTMPVPQELVDLWWSSALSRVNR